MTDSWAIVYRRSADSVSSQAIVEAHQSGGAFEGGELREMRIGNISVHTFSWASRPMEGPPPRAIHLCSAGVGLTLKEDWPSGATELEQIRSRIENRPGHWNEVYVSPAELITYSSASGFRPVFYYEDQDCVVVGTNPAAIRDALSIGPDFSGLAEAYLISTTQVPGEINLYPGIERIPLGAYLRVSPETGALVINFNSNIFDPPTIEGLGEARAFIRDFLPSVVENVRETVATQEQVVVDITGGVDSRATLSLMLSAVDDLGKITVRTFGAEGNPEIEIAERVVQILELSDRHRVEVGDKTRDISFNELRIRAVGSIIASAGYRQGFDSGWPRGPLKAPKFLANNGQAPDLMKEAAGPDSVTIETWLNRWSRFDTLELLHESKIFEIRDHAKSRIREFTLSKSASWLMWTFANDRKPNWGAVPFWNPANRVDSPFYHPQIARLFHSRLPLGNLAHYELIRMLQPSLLEIPFGDKAWTRWAAEAATLDGVPPVTPVPFKIESVYPWQFDAYRRYSAQILSEIRQLRDYLDGVVSATALDREFPDVPKSSADIKTLFACWGLAMLAGGVTIDSLLVARK